MTATRFGSALLLASLVWSCGGAPPSAAEQAPPAAPPAAPAAMAPRQPAPAPADIVVTARWQNPMATLTTLGAAAGMTAPDTKLQAQHGLAVLLSPVLDDYMSTAELESLISAEAPVDAIVTLDANTQRMRGPIAAISLGLTSLEGAKRAAEKKAALAELAPGIYKVGGKDRKKQSCVISASVGAAPARLICGTSDKDVAMVAPYLSLTTPTLPAPKSDLTLDVNLAPVKSRYGTFVKQGLGQGQLFLQTFLTVGDRQLDKLTAELSMDLKQEVGRIYDDLQGLHVSITQSATTGTSFLASLDFGSKSSWLARSIESTKPGPAPEMFWKLPKTSTTAYYAFSSDPALTAPVLTQLGALAEAGMWHYELGTPADRKGMKEVFAPLSVTSIPVVVAKGRDASGMEWNVQGIGVQGSTYSKRISDFVALYNRPALKRSIAKRFPKVGKDYLPEIKAAKAPKELGKGAVAYEINLNLKFLPANVQSKIKDIPSKIFFVAIPGGDVTWVGYSQDLKSLINPLKTVSGTPASSETLASTEDLASLKTSPAGAAGYFSLRTWLDAFEAQAKLGNDEIAKKVGAFFHDLPHGGTTPAFFRYEANPNGKLQPSITANLPKGMLEDALSPVAALLKAKKARP